MIGHEGVAKRVKHDEPEHWTQGRGEVDEGDLRPAPQVPPGKINHRGQRSSRQEPDVIQRISGRDRPARITECEVDWPQELAQVKPERAAGDEEALRQTDGEKLAL